MIEQTPTSAISADLRRRLTAKITEDGIAPPLAERILDQTVAFLRLVADSPGQGFSPSPLVDIGWHAFILHTRDYAQFCERVAGRFIHHDPDDGVGGVGRAAVTAAAMRVRGIEVDEGLWYGAAQCGAHCRATRAATTTSTPRTS